MALEPSDWYSERAEGFAMQTDRTKMPETIRRIRDAFLAQVDGDQVLDAGCGPGHDTDYFAEHGYDATGIDIAPGMIDYARDHNEGDYTVGDLYDLPFDDEQFDGVWCNASIMFQPPSEWQDAINELYRVTADEGTLQLAAKLGKGPTRVTVDDGTVIQYKVPESDLWGMLDEAGYQFESAETHRVSDEKVFGNYFCQK